MSAVLEGTVRKAGNRLRITVQLTSVADGRTLWSERYDREMADVFAIQDEIAGTIVRTLRSTLLGDLGDPTPVRYTENVRAYSLYLKGRFWWNRRTQAAIAEGIRYFEQAIAEDPGYALAYSGLADSYALDLDYRGAPVIEGMERAKAEARKAIELDETLAEAHTSLGWVTFIYDWDWVGAEREFSRAIELNPRYSTARQWYSWFLVAMGRFEEALAEGRAAIELDPALGVHPAQPGVAAVLCPPVSTPRWTIFGGRWPWIPPPRRPTGSSGWSMLQQGRYDEAAASFREAVANSESDMLSFAGLGQVAALRGRADEARAVLQELQERQRTRYCLTGCPRRCSSVALGEVDAAFEWLEKSAPGAAGLAGISEDRADPRSTALRSPVSRLAGADAADVDGRSRPCYVMSMHKIATEADVATALCRAAGRRLQAQPDLPHQRHRL